MPRAALLVATAYDAAEHVSSAYGYFADDSQWDWLSEIFGNGGTKQIPFAGYYTSYPRISKALFLEYGDPSGSTRRRRRSRSTGASSR